MKLSKQQLEMFDEQGFLLLKGVLDPIEDLNPAEQELQDVFDCYAQILMNKWAPELVEDFSKKPFIERFVTLLGLTEGNLFAHLEPQLLINYKDKNFSKDPDLPDLFLPELYRQSQNNKILDIIESFFGPEITASSHIHIHIKPSNSHLNIGSDISKKYRTGKFTSRFASLNFLKTDWHTDNQSRNADCRANKMIIAWVPLTEATQENSCLLVLPRSHKEQGNIAELDHANAQAIECSKGDLIIFDSGLIHCSTINTSKSDYRIAINYRYVQKGTLVGQYSSPSYVVRSKSAPMEVLKNAHLYFHYLNSAINFFYKHPETKVHSNDLQEAKEISRAWEERITCYDDWLNIKPDKLNLLNKFKKIVRPIWTYGLQLSAKK